MKAKRVLIYGDIDLNVIDGSSVWLQSVALAFAEVPGWTVTLFSKTALVHRELVAPLEAHDDIEVVDPFATQLLPNLKDSLSPTQIHDVVLEELLGAFDVVLIRGRRIADVMCREALFADRLWTYLTDIPQRAELVTSQDLEWLGRVVAGSQVVMCQTEGLRSLFEQVIPEAVGKTWLLPPMIPAVPAVRPAEQVRRPIQIVYAGKFAPDWNTLEMCGLPAVLSRLGTAAKLVMIGDKVHNPADEPDFFPNMSQALERSEGVHWVKRLARDDVQRALANADIGIGWRGPSLSESLELSTKLLEYGAAGIAVVVNRTPVHEQLLGSDYPLFAETFDDVVERIQLIQGNHDVYELARSRSMNLGNDATIHDAAQRLAEIAGRVVVTPGESQLTTKVLVMSHDFKFFTGIERGLIASPGLKVSRDQWTGLLEHDEEQSLQALDDASVVVCEWCGPNAAFASHNKRPGQKLIVRLHRFELYRRYPHEVDIDAVDAVVTVSSHYRNLVLERLQWPPEKVVVIPNYVDVAQFDRPKFGDVRFNLGMIGIAPVTRKRFDRALRILAGLRRVDRRFTLFVKSKHVWEYDYMWANPDERSAYIDDFGQLHRDEDLNAGVVFDGFGSDVARWLRKIGHVISTSDDESFHLAPVEGMAGGSVPALYPWPGADCIYSAEWIYSDEQGMVDGILAAVGDWDDLAAEARRQARAIDLPGVIGLWRELVDDPSGFANRRGEGNVPIIQ